MSSGRTGGRSWLKLTFAFCLPLIILTVLSLITVPLANVASAQDAAAAANPYEAIDTGETAWILTCSALVLFMTPGLAFFYGGLVRSRNVLNTMMMSLVSMGIVGVTWILWGYSLSFNYSSLNDKNFATGLEQFIGGLGWFGLNGVGLDPHPVYAATIPHQAFMVYQMMFAIITVALVSGAIAERMSFKAYFWFLVLWSTFIYCPLAHMVWGRGLLGAMGALDFAGGTVVHVSSGVSALVAAWLLGPRKDWTVKPIVPHNVPFVLLGVGILWFGWFGFNGGSAIGIGADVTKYASATVAVIATTVAASAAGLAWLLAEWFTKGKPTAVGIGTGFVAGLVGITPAAGFVTPLSAIVIGAIVSLCCFVAVNIKAKLQFDDSLDTFPVHGVGGTIGAILTGIFATKAVNGIGADGLLFGNPGQLWTQILGVLIAWVIAAVGTLIILKVLSLFMELRVRPEVEDEGLDVHEHGEEGYGENLAGELSFATKTSEP
ncbi:MAG: ammonium transporter [Leptolyngbyaceae cyanobacterium RU_5_1]|nr:ammonium transporter [Leptolyngbyaceae cyanobacterium RU_5_1]